MLLNQNLNGDLGLILFQISSVSLPKMIQLLHYNQALTDILNSIVPFSTVSKLIATETFNFNR